MDTQDRGCNDYVTRVLRDPAQLPVQAWNALLATQPHPTPFMRAEYLAALHASGSATAETGWDPHFVTLWRGDELLAACPLYAKAHSMGEYVFDWAWAEAYARHRQRYYPKAVIAVPFTPVPGSRLLAHDADARRALLDAVLALCRERGWSSLHLLFGAQADLATADAAGLMQRQAVQFHWQNPGWRSFDEFLSALTQDKRKKVRQERRRVADAGVRFRVARGRTITADDWAFFYRCYERTYLEHGNLPYLTPDFFARMAGTMPEAWTMFTAERAGKPVAASLIAVQQDFSGADGQYGSSDLQKGVAWGRYWGAVERVDCLHFAACYHEPIDWCIRHGIARFEGGAQGEHKMARALLPVVTPSAHWLAHPVFAEAVGHYLEREGEGVARYLSHLDERSPLRRTDQSPARSPDPSGKP